MKKLLCGILAVGQVMVGQSAMVKAETEFVNISLNCTSTASSESEDIHSSYYANDGINDNAENSWWQSNMEDTSPWWQIDLGVEYQVVRIEYQPRIDAPAEECSNFEIIASNDETFDSYDVLISQETAVDGNATYDINNTNRYRYVRARKTDSKVFSIAELNLFTERNSISIGATQGTDYIAGGEGEYNDEMRYSVAEDVVGTKYEEDVWLLSQLDIMRGYEDGNFKPGNRVTRAEIATIVSRILTSTQKYTSQKFSDVPNTHWAYNYIEQCAAYGYVNGMNDGTFEPESLVTTTQIMTIFVRMLGYTMQAEQSGGWPNGYTATAGILGLYNAVESGEDITRGEIAGVLVDVLETDVMVSNYSSSNFRVEVSKDNPALRSFKHIVKNTGIIKAAGITSLTETFISSRNGYVEIDDAEYVTNIPWITEYLGCKVDYYYCEDEGEEGYELVAAIPKRNNIMVIEANEYTYGADGKIYYSDEDGKKEEYEEIGVSVDLIYNGTAYTDYYKLEDIVPQDGVIKLIDNNNDNKWDIIIIDSEETYVVRVFREAEDKLYVKGSTVPIDIDTDNDTISVINAETNEAIGISELKEWDVISIRQNNPNSETKVFNIIVSSSKIRGVVTGKSEDSIFIDRVEYDYVPSFDIDSINMSDSGFFYLDYKGRIAAYNSESSFSDEYGFIRAVIYDENVDDSVSLKVFNEDGEFEILELASRVKIDGMSFKNNKNIVSHLNTTSENGKGAQIIKYRVNSANLITSLDTTYRDYEHEDDTSLTKKYGASARYYMSSGVIGMEFVRGDNTVMMRIPADVTEDDQYEIVPSSYMTNAYQYSFEAYDASDNNIMGLFLFRDTNQTTFATQTTYMIIEKVWNEINDDDEERTYVSGVYEGKYVKFCEYKEDIIDQNQYGFGDIVAINLNSRDEITAIEKRFYAGEKPEDAADKSISTSPEESQYGQPFGDTYMAYGYIAGREDVFATVKFPSADQYSQIVVNLTHQKLTICVVDSETKEVRIGGKNDVLDAQSAGEDSASKVFVSGYFGDIYQLVILN